MNRRMRTTMNGATESAPPLPSADASMPFSDDQMRSWGYIAWRCLSDGTVMAVGPMLFGNGRLYVDVNAHGYGDCYCYDGVECAVENMRMFDAARDAEPMGWKRHPATGRRRQGGDPESEYVAM